MREVVLELRELPAENGGADASLVTDGPDGRPWCRVHGAMNKVSPDGIWRCISTTSATAGKRCNAGVLEVERWSSTPPSCVCDVGVQECQLHPGQLRTRDEQRAFAKAWDARVVPSNPEQMRAQPGAQRWDYWNEGKRT